jgi:hypothetical protein
LPENIGLEWKFFKVASTAAYYNTATITAAKSVIVQTPLLKEFVNQLVKQQFIPKPTVGKITEDIMFIDKML